MDIFWGRMNKKIMLWIIVLLLFASCVHAVSITNGLIFSYDFEEGSGTKAVDDSNKHNGTISGGNWRTGKVNTYSYNSNSSNLVSSGVITGNGVNEFSACAWVNRSSSETGEGFFIGEYGASGSWGIQVLTSATYNDSLYLSIVQSTGGCYGKDPKGDSVNNGQWHHVCVTFKRADSCKIYKNGVLINSSVAGNYATRASTADVEIGSDGAGARDFVGQIDQAIVWNRTINITEIERIYNEGVGLEFPFTLLKINYHDIESYEGTKDITALINCTATDGYVNQVYGNITFPNGTTTSLGTNYTYEGDGLWNSSPVTLDIVGSYSITSVCEDNNSNKESSTIVKGVPVLYISIYDENTGNPITENVTITFLSNTTEFSNITNTGAFNISFLDDNEYRILFQAINYSSRSYMITTGTPIIQYLNVFLPLNTTTAEVIFTISDKDTSETLSNALISMYRLINDTWSVVESKYSDITGKAQFTYIMDERYKFFISKEGYTDYVFFLDPILFSEYDVKMEKSSLINYSQDYDNLAIIYSPTSFYCCEENSFNWIISSPTGLLGGYGYTLTYPGGTDTQTGSNALGGQLTSAFNMTNPQWYDSVTLNYYYITTLSGRRNFTIILPISFTNGTGNSTFMANRDKTYGLAIFERMLICTLIVIFVVGIATMVGQAIPGFALGLMVFGYMVYIGFIPIWGILPSLFIGVIFLIWKSGG